jgi:hypothetical protein
MFTMKWEEVRLHYPHQWLLVEALKAHSDAGKRVLDHVVVINSFADSAAALQDYAQLHHKAPERELYVFHTDQEQIDLTERKELDVQDWLTLFR